MKTKRIRDTITIRLLRDLAIAFYEADDPESRFSHFFKSDANKLRARIRSALQRELKKAVK